MAKPQSDMFAGQARHSKLAQYTRVLNRLNALVDWSGLAKAVNDATGREGERPKGGRPPYPTQVMLKIVVLQQLYGNVADEEMEYALLDRLSWQRFVGLEDARDLPDARTIWAFKQLIAQGGGTEALFDEVLRQLDAAGLKAKGGQLIDATLIDAPKAHLDKHEKADIEQGKTPGHWSAKVAAHRDRDAHWSAKHGKWFYGYKAHINADQAHKLIRRIQVTPGNVGDTRLFEAMIDTDKERARRGKTVYADRGYDSQANRRLLKDSQLCDAIARNDDRQRYDQSDVHRRNARLSRTRARVEHVFGGWEKTMGKSLRCVGLVRARAHITLQAVVYNWRRWVSLQGSGAPAAA
ncbi:MAG: IS5 family transposase [Burkholderiales bacterium]|nr:IS5 family transposase [Burkholderiales bacterium]